MKIIKRFAIVLISKIDIIELIDMFDEIILQKLLKSTELHNVSISYVKKIDYSLEKASKKVKRLLEKLQD